MNEVVLVPKTSETPRTNTSVKKVPFFWGRIIWIHPQERFVLVIFRNGSRECFYPDELEFLDKSGEREKTKQQMEKDLPYC